MVQSMSHGSRVPSPTLRAQALSLSQSIVVELAASLFGKNCHLVKTLVSFLLPFLVSIVDEPLVVDYVDDHSRSTSARYRSVQQLVDTRHLPGASKVLDDRLSRTLNRHPGIGLRIIGHDAIIVLLRVQIFRGLRESRIFLFADLEFLHHVCRGEFRETIQPYDGNWLDHPDDIFGLA